ncbi:MULTISPECIES: DUF6448 family protein [unclassified Nocardioides]|uniref:DUF6448 family protein n=1 Tax=unclassified Nocardioides TaxID=2615069 RepID=UPI000056FE77|nr:MULTISPECIES: DUF6448 family protein [unclassified Nocardioides]ABL83178.1 conserved hypothetical protein [Nocardioides sp. JS614]
MVAASKKFLARAVLRSRIGRAVVALLAATAVAVPLMLGTAAPASAHCDSAQGPVATAARDALAEGNVDLVLPYVKADQEEELTAAFNQTVAIRDSSAEVRELADQYFVETAVRLHRVGEGASYTGLKDDVEISPALAAAETSLEQGTKDQVFKVLKRDLRAELTDRFAGVLEAREAEQGDPSVATARERAEAELMFEKYILEIETAVNAEPGHDAPAGGEGH